MVIKYSGQLKYVIHDVNKYVYNTQVEQYACIEPWGKPKCYLTLYLLLNFIFIF